ncbi:hypothetical protein OAL29_00885 [Candidatus Binatia bacterium]|nr:hypothetical protein [Candidatus Binatia bacterium]
MTSIIGTDPNQVPTNADLGTMAYQDYDTYTNQVAVGRKNLLLNSGMRVWQRGTPVNTTMYCADRWMIWSTNSGVSNRNVNVTQQTGGPIGHNSNYLTAAFQVVDTGIEKLAWGQKIESHNLRHIKSGQRVTLSFWIKKEQDLPTDNNMDIQILYPNSTDSWGSGYLFRNDYNIDSTVGTIKFNSLSTDWQKYTYTFTVGDTALTRGIAVYWHIGDNNFNLGNTDAIFSFTGAQLEVGNQATDLEQESYASELAACQRYFERWQDYSPQSQDSSGSTSTEVLLGLGLALTSSRVLGRLNWMTPKRVPPTVSLSNSSQMQTIQTGAWYSATNTPNFRAQLWGCRPDFNHSGSFLAGGAVEMRFNNDGTNAYLNIDAEL